jgi:FkbH-like protein
MQTDIKYTELLRRNVELAQTTKQPFRVAVLSNITVSPLKEVLEYSLRSRGINANVEIGNYDNVVQECIKYRSHDAIFILYELANLADKLPYTLHEFDSQKLALLSSKVKEGLSHCFEILASSKVVIFNLLTALPFSSGLCQPNTLDNLCNDLNRFVQENAPKSFKLIDVNKLLAFCSIRAAIDLRFFLSSRALYTYSFFRAYAEFVSPIIGVAAGHYKKVLVLDCDNTLWRGIVGEDGFEGIQIYAEIQSLIVQLAKRGVLICLCSKNNPEDVDLVLRNHPRMILKEEHIVIKGVSWNDKVHGIKGIAQALNLGLDSVVFLDDSDFELEFVRDQLPSVTAFKVPSNYSEYLQLFQVVESLFYRESTTKEDEGKIAQYKTEFARNEQRIQYGNLDSYLSSLELSIKVSVNAEDLVPRLAQLTQKTNQFNMTNRRMSESEVYSATTSKEFVVAGVSVKDKFGEYGTTGLILARQKDDQACIENFLFSCRVIGRGVELKAFDIVVDLLRARGVREIYGSFHPTHKNDQVKDWYPKIGFVLVSNETDVLRFRLDVDRYHSSGQSYIGVHDA